MLELPWVALFILFSPLWWILLIGASIALIWALDDDRFGLATIVIAATLALMTFCGGTEIWVWLANHKMTFLYGIVGYFIGGAIWGIVKWYLFSLNRLEEYETIKIQWLQNQGIEGKTIPNNLKIAWLEHLKDTSFVDTKYITINGDRTTKILLNVKPLAWNNKGRILTWMTYWPWSLLWSLLDDVIKNIFRRIQKLLGNLMDRISTFVFRNVEDDFVVDGKKTTDIEKKS